MKNSEKHVFPARRASLQPVLAFVEAYCERQGVAVADMLRLTLIVEELFTNTLMHGHRGDSTSSVNIELAAGPTHLLLGFQDDAPPFDPLQYLASRPPAAARPVEALEPGGHGLPLVARMSERFDYVRIGGRNHSTLMIRRSA